MDLRTKNILRDYFDFKDIRTIKREAELNTSNEAWELLRTTYNQLNPQNKLKKTKPKVKVAPIKVIKQKQKQRQARQQRLRQIAGNRILGAFRRFLDRRRNRTITNQALDGQVITRTYTPITRIPYTLDNTYRLANIAFRQISRPAQAQHIIVRARFYVIKQDGSTFYQNRRIWEGNYNPANRAEIFVRIRNEFEEQLDRGFGDTQGYDAYVINIRITSTLLNLAGGCAGSNIKGGKQFDIGQKDYRWKCFSPKGEPTTNNCFFNCIGVKGAKTRKELKIPIKTPISLTQIPQILDHTKIGIKLYNAQQKILLEYGKDYDTQKELVLINNHYSLVIKKSNRCKDCGKLYLDKHTCNQKRRQYWAFLNGNKKSVIKNNKKLRDEPIDYNQIIYYDFETFMEGNSFVVYAAGYFNPTTGQAEHFYGKDSITDFVKYMIKQEGKTFIAHNGSRFDCYFIINEMIKQNISMEHFIMNNGAIMTFEFGTANKLIDSCCFISSSLSDAGKSFKIPPEYYKSEFDHTKIKNWDDTNKYRQEVVDYLNLDVLCLKYVWESFSDRIFDKFRIHTIDFITTSSMTYYLWTLVNESEIYLPSQDELDFINKSKYGANVYPVKKHFKSKEYDDIINGKVKYEDMTDYLMIMDVVSLYPTSMLKDYPVGKSEWVGDRDHTKLGIYEIKFKPPKDILYPQLPRKDKGGGILHSLEDGQGVYNSIDIDRAIDAGYKVEYIQGLEWAGKDKVFDFYIRDTFELKCKAKEEDDAVMYAISKLLLNGLYGKTLQRPIYTKAEIINNHNDAIEFINTIDVLDDAEILSPNAVMYSGEVMPKDREKAITKPTQLGSFVLGYSRTIMYNIIKRLTPDLSKHVFYYTDTDCLHINGYDLPKIQDLLGDELGQLNSDLKNEGRIIEGIYLAPKQYAVEYIGNDNKIVNKQKCKGIIKKYLKTDMYHNALNKKSTDVIMKDSFKKINYKRNNNQKEFDKFSIHLEDINRTFHKNEWLGRSWNKNCSYPIGHNYCKEQNTKTLQTFNLPLDIINLIV